jgi:succinate dehydrogenase / fumarate reductase flavoprotein subunit
MDRYVGVFRERAGLEAALSGIASIRKRLSAANISDKSLVFNTQLVHLLETENLALVAEATTLAALARQESRGAHFRVDFPRRDDERFLKHSLVNLTPEGELSLDYQPVKITRLQPAKREY